MPRAQVASLDDLWLWLVVAPNGDMFSKCVMEEEGTEMEVGRCSASVGARRFQTRGLSRPKRKSGLGNSLGARAGWYTRKNDCF